MYEPILAATAARLGGDGKGFVVGSWTATPWLRWLYYSMSWMVVEWPKPSLIIPDSGLIKMPQALVADNGEAWLPLSARRALRMSWYGYSHVVGLVRDASPDYAALLRAGAVYEADRFVYGHDYDEDIDALVRQKTPDVPQPRRPIRARGLNRMLPFLPVVRGLNRLVTDLGWNLCMAPAAGRSMEHKWLDHPLAKPLKSNVFHDEIPTLYCAHCFAFRWVFPNGQHTQVDMELGRQNPEHPLHKRHNWWEVLDIEVTPKGMGVAQAQPPNDADSAQGGV